MLLAPIAIMPPFLKGLVEAFGGLRISQATGNTPRRLCIILLKWRHIITQRLLARFLAPLLDQAEKFGMRQPLDVAQSPKPVFADSASPIF